MLYLPTKLLWLWIALLWEMTIICFCDITVMPQLDCLHFKSQKLRFKMQTDCCVVSFLVMIYWFEPEDCKESILHSLLRLNFYVIRVCWAHYITVFCGTWIKQCALQPSSLPLFYAPIVSCFYNMNAIFTI